MLLFFSIVRYTQRRERSKSLKVIFWRGVRAAKKPKQQSCFRLDSSRGRILYHQRTCHVTRVPDNYIRCMSKVRERRHLLAQYRPETTQNWTMLSCKLLKLTVRLGFAKVTLFEYFCQGLQMLFLERGVESEISLRNSIWLKPYQLPIYIWLTGFQESWAALIVRGVGL